MPACRSVCHLSVVLGLCLPALLQAQQTDALAGQLLASEVQLDLADPTLSSPARMPHLQAVLSATTSKTEAVAEVGIKASDTFSGSFKISGPLTKQGNDTKLASLTGLTDQATFTLGIHYLTSNPVAQAFTNSSVSFKETLCDAWTTDHPGGECPKGVSTNDISPRARRQVLRGLGLSSGIGILSAEATYGAPKTFDFLTSGAFMNEQERHNSISAAVSAGWLPLRQGFYFAALTYRYERSFTSSGAKDICLPLGSPGDSNCQNLPVGPPQRQISNIMQLEMRRYFDGGSFAVNPRLSRDFKQKVSGFELPFYFLKDGTGLLNGGLSAGWRSDTKSVTVTAFVGSMSNPLGSSGK